MLQRTAEDVYGLERRRLVEDIRWMSSEAAGFPVTPISRHVLDIIGKVPRHRFVPAAETLLAYDNHPLPIGHGQTISQPYIVALMTDLLQLGRQHCVLEIGTGSGYQAAVLAELAGQVYSMEIVPQLAEAASARLRELGYDNVEVKCGDGSDGWPEHAPYDGIIVTAAAEHIPRALLNQLKPGGRMVIPVGGWLEAQELILMEKQADGTFRSKCIEPVRFVPLIGAG